MNNSINPRSKSIKIRVTPEEYNYIQHNAELSNMKLSAYIRNQLLQPVQPYIQPKDNICIYNSMQHIIDKYSYNSELVEDLDNLYNLIREVHHGNPKDNQ